MMPVTAEKIRRIREKSKLIIQRQSVTG